MSAFQWTAVLITFGLSALDGFDVLAITLVAPSLVHTWGVNPAALGSLFSVGLVGMAIGSFLVAPIADVLGRRIMLIVTLALMSGAMLMCARAADVHALALWRFINGLGIGATVAIINPLAAEYANLKRRDLAIGLMAIGFPIGGVVGGAAAAYLLAHQGWRDVFLLGAIIGGALLVLVLVLLPEPIAFALGKRGAGALNQVNRFLRRCGHPTVGALPVRLTGTRRPSPLAIFHAANRGATMHVATIMLLYVLTVYFFINWIPQMVAAAGFTAAIAAKVSVIANVCGCVGGSLLGWGASRLGLKRLALTAFFGLGVSVIAFGFASANLVSLTLTAAAAGFCLHSGMVAMHSVIARTFPPHMRATGAGFVLGVGRIGSATAPAAAGYMFNAGVPRSGVSMVMAISALIAGGLLLTFRLREVGIDERPAIDLAPEATIEHPGDRVSALEIATA